MPVRKRMVLAGRILGVIDVDNSLLQARTEIALALSHAGMV